MLFDNIITGKGFELLDALLKKGEIVNDIYELDNFDKSIFHSLLTKLPLDEDALNYFKDFLQRSDNLNDEVSGYSLLSYAFNIKARPEIIKALIEAGLRTDFKNTAQDNLVNQVVRMNMVPEDLHKQYLEMLIDAGVPVTEPNIVKQTALHVAVDTDKPQLFDLLLSNGADPNEQDSKGNSAFYYALAHKLNADYYQKLSEYASPDFSSINRDGQTILTEYLRMGPSVKLLERLIDDGASMDTAAPYYSKAKSGWEWVAEGSLEVLAMVLDKNLRDVNTQDDEGNTLLHYICGKDCNYSQEAAKTTYKKVKLLLEKGADVFITNAKEQTPMMLAATDNLKGKTVELLLSKK
jgi:ankyrin repeat protein